jgi:hypothetical protein
MSWYSPELKNPFGYTSQACLASFKTSYGLDHVHDFYFPTQDEGYIAIADKRVAALAVELPSVYKIFKDMGLTYGACTDAEFNEKMRPSEYYGAVASEPLNTYTAKQLQWAFNYVRFDCEYSTCLQLLDDLNTKFETCLPLNILWLLSHRWRDSNAHEYRVSTDCIHTMYGEFNSTVDLPLFMAYINDACKPDISSSVKTDYIYWSKIRSRVPTDKKDAEFFKDVKNIPVLYKDKVSENEQAWFCKILPAVNIITKYLEV